MNTLRDVEKYLNKILGLQLRFKPWRGADLLSFTLRDRYDYFKTDILGCRCLLVIDKDGSHVTPTAIRKQTELIAKEWSGDVVYVREKVTASNRDRFIQNRISFIVPGYQLYLPLLAINLREHFSSTPAPVKWLSPSTQILVLHSIYNHYNPFFPDATKKDIAQRLGYTKMTMTRAFRELREVVKDKIDLVQAEGDTLWKQVKPFLRSPIRQHFFYDIGQNSECENSYISGECALSCYTMLAGPSHKVVCMSSGDWRVFHKDNAGVQIDYPEEDVLEVEVWRYKPELLAIDRVADPLSVLLSLQTEEDERVEMALQEIRKNWLW